MDPPNSSRAPGNTNTLRTARVGRPNERSLKRRWIVTASVALAAAGVALVDQRVMQGLTQEDVVAAVETAFWAPVASSFYWIIAAILFAFPNRKRLVPGFLAPVLLSAFVTHVLKFVVGRARPDMGLGPDTFAPMNWLGEYQSFPSGHSSAAATLAVLLGIYFPRARWVFYFFMVCVGLERIIHNRHFTSDVLAGFAIGAGSVYLCVQCVGPAFYRLGVVASVSGDEPASLDAGRRSS